MFGIEPTFYTGVGARATPRRWCEAIARASVILQQKGWTLRSGGARGADLAWESGAGLNKRIYRAEHARGHQMAMNIARHAHPNWGKLSDYTKLLHARNAFQVLGDDLMTPSKFLVCWTPKGEEAGGTRTAIVIARMYDVPVYNLGKPWDAIRFKEEALQGERAETWEKPDER